MGGDNMCLSTAYRSNDPDSIIMEYVSRIEVKGSQITLTDVMGDTRTVEGTLSLADLTGGVVRIDCQES
jgi:predicted RNA-binding protein